MSKTDQVKIKILPLLNEGKQIDIATEDGSFVAVRKSNSRSGAYYVGQDIKTAEEAADFVAEKFLKSLNPATAADHFNRGTYCLHGLTGNAEEFWKRAADMGHRHAQYTFAFLLASQRKKEEAAYYYTLAAQQQHPAAKKLFQFLQDNQIYVEEYVEDEPSSPPSNHSSPLAKRKQDAGERDVFSFRFNAISAKSQQEEDEKNSPSILLSPISPALTRLGDEEPGVVNFGGKRIEYSETIGNHVKRLYEVQQDAFLVGEASNAYSGDVATILQNACLEFGGLLKSNFGHNSRYRVDAGTTGIIAHLATSQKLTIANVGDSRAVLCAKKADGSFKLIRLTNDHSPNNEEERQRIEQAGGYVMHDGACYRTNGNLSLSRSFGDCDDEMINNEPDLYSYELEKILREHDVVEGYLLMSCDGLYPEGGANELSYAAALEKWFKNEGGVQAQFKNNVAYYLQECAINMGGKQKSYDNITVIFCPITGEQTIDLMFGVFDGHRGAKNDVGGDIVNGQDLSGLAADFFANRFLSSERRLVKSSARRNQHINLQSLLPSTSPQVASNNNNNNNNNNYRDDEYGGIEF
ncbi:MAG: hypothetical protein FJX34_03805 [Alphaproteobacteria bacterium]|nr:hypothetical protein [Alphaproteobacteria bacterium]